MEPDVEPLANPSPLIDPLPGPGPKPKPPTKQESDAAFQAEVASRFQQQDKQQQKSLTPVKLQAIGAQDQVMSPEETAQARRYTDRGETYLRGRNNEAVAAGNQTYTDRLWNDVKGTTANFLGSIGQVPLVVPQMLKAAVSLLKGDGQEAVQKFRGEEGSWMNDINKWQDEVNENATNFQSGWAKANPWKNALVPIAGEGGTDFGSLVRSAGFLLGGVATSLAENAVGDLLAPFTAGASAALAGADTLNRIGRGFRKLETIGKSLETLTEAAKTARAAEGVYHGVDVARGLGKVWSGFNTPLGKLGLRSELHALLLNNGEASLEGYHAEQESLANLIQDYKTRTGVDPDEDILAKFKQTALQTGNSTFLFNHALLGITNKFQIDTIIKNFGAAGRASAELSGDLFTLQRKAGTGVLEVVESKALPRFNPSDKWYQKAYATVAQIPKSAGNMALAGFSDGLEEQLQSAIATGTTYYYQTALNSKNKTTLDDRLKAAGVGLQEAFGTSEGWTEFAGGLLTAGIFGGAIRGVTDHLNKPAIRQQFEGFAKASGVLPEVFRNLALQQMVGGAMGSSLLDKTMQANAALQAGELAIRAAKDGDQLIFQHQKNAGQFELMHPFVQQGAGSVLREQFDSFKKDIEADSASFAKAFGMDEGTSKDVLLATVQSMDTKLGQLEKTHERLGNLHRNPYTDVVKKDPSTVNQLLALEWNRYYQEMLRNDFLRQQYGDRIKALTPNTNLLGDVSPYISPEGWAKHRLQAEDRLKQLDREMADAVSLMRKDHDTERDGPLDQALDREAKAITFQQKVERKKLTSRIDRVTKLQGTNFANYDQVVAEILDDLREAESPGVTDSTTIQELKDQLQNTHDVHSLQESIKILAKQFNALGSTGGFEAHAKERKIYEIAQIQDALKEEKEAREQLTQFVYEQFTSPAEATQVIGSVSHLISFHLGTYAKDPQGTKDKIKEVIEAQKLSMANQLAIRTRLIEQVTTLLESDNQFAARMEAHDKDRKITRQLIEQILDAAPGKDLMEIQQEVQEAFAVKFPPTVTATAPAQPGIVTSNEDDDAQDDPVEIDEAVDDPVEPDLAVDDEPATVGTDPLVSVDEVFGTQPAVPVVMIHPPNINNGGVVEDMPGAGEDDIFDDVFGKRTDIKDQVAPVSTLVDETQEGKSFTPTDTDPRVDVNDIFGPPKAPESTSVAVTSNGAGTSILDNTLFSTGMTIVNIGGIDVPQYMRPGNHENPGVFGNPDNVALWEEIVQDRYEIVQALEEKEKLSDLVDWQVISLPDMAMKLTPFPTFQNPGLQRATVRQYLVARRKGAAKPAWLVIPMQENLYLSPALQKELLLNKEVADLVLDPAKLTQLLTGKKAASLAQVLAAGGENLFTWLKTHGPTRSVPWLNIQEDYAQYLDMTNRFSEWQQGLQQHVDGEGNLGAEGSAYLDALDLSLQPGDVFYYNAGEMVSLQELSPAASFVKGDPAQLLVYMTTDTSGQPLVTIIEEATGRTLSNEIWQDLVREHPELATNLTEKAGWKNRNPGNYLIVRDGRNNLFRFKVINEEGLGTLTQQIQQGIPITDRSIVLVGSRDEVYLPGLELMGRELDQGILRLSYQEDIDGEVVTYYSNPMKPTDLAKIKKLTGEAAEAAVQKALTGMLRSLSFTKDKVKQKPRQAPEEIKVQIGAKNRSGRMVQIASRAVFQRVDVHWTPKEILEENVPKPFAFDLPVPPVESAGPGQAEPGNNDTDRVDELAAIGFPLDWAQAVIAKADGAILHTERVTPAMRINFGQRAPTGPAVEALVTLLTKKEKLSLGTTMEVPKTRQSDDLESRVAELLKHCQ